MDTEIRILYDNQERTEYVMKAPHGTRTDESWLFNPHINKGIRYAICFRIESGYRYYI